MTEGSTFLLNELPEHECLWEFEGSSELDWQIGDQVFISDNGTSQHVTCDADRMLGYRECRRVLRMDGNFLPVEGEGDLLIFFRSGCCFEMSRMYHVSLTAFSLKERWSIVITRTTVTTPKLQSI